MVSNGMSGSFQCTTDQPLLLYGGELKPTFFDAQLFTTEQLACYNKKNSIPGMLHSGDLTYEQHFMHSITCTEIVDEYYAASAVGFQRTKLQKFEAVSPFILLVDHVNSIMFAIPFSLEPATVGDSTLIAPLLFHMNNSGLISWHIPSSCPFDDKIVTTGEYSDNFKKKMRNLKQNFFSMFQKYFEDQDKANKAADTDKVNRAKFVSKYEIAPSIIDSFKTAIFIQNGVNDLSYTSALDRIFVNFGTSLSITKDCLEITKSSSVVLPILSGEAHGHPALALGDKATSFFQFQILMNILNASMI